MAIGPPSGPVAVVLQPVHEEPSRPLVRSAELVPNVVGGQQQMSRENSALIALNVSCIM